MKNSISNVIKNKNISRRELDKFTDVVMECQKDNLELISILFQNTYRVIDKKILEMFYKTIDALFNSLDYPTEEWAITDSQQLKGYQYIKDAIIEYCTTEIKDISVITDNVAFIHDTTMDNVDKDMQSYMSNYGDTSKIMNAFYEYSDDYKKHITKHNNKEVYIPIYSKAVASKLYETKNNIRKV